MKVSELLDRIQTRLGQMKGSAGWDAQRQQVLWLVQDSVSLLTEEFRMRLLYVPNVMLQPAQKGDYDVPGSITSYKPPVDADPHRITDLSVKWGGIWHTVPKGITQDMRNAPYSPTSTYCAWDIIECGELEVWPHPTKMHDVRVSYTREPATYEDEEAAVDMNPQLLVLLTLNAAIPLYGRPDGESVNRALNKMLGNLKAKEVQGIMFNKSCPRPRCGTPDAMDNIYRWPSYQP